MPLTTEPLCRAAAVASAALLQLALAGAATAATWVGSGSWDNKDNWDPKQVPTASDTVYINGTAQASGVSAASYEAQLGWIAGESGKVEVRTSEGQWGNASTVYAGYRERSTGTVDIGAKGSASAGGLVLGFAALSAGVLRVADSESRFDTNGMTIGWDGDGQMEVLSGGYVDSAQGAYMGYRLGSGRATVSGSGSFWNLGGKAFVGYDASALVEVRQGGKVSSSDLTIGGGVANTSDGRRGHGLVIISGPGSSWSSSGSLTVGSHNETNYATGGDLRILDGASFSAASYAQIALGPKGSVLVSGAGSRWSVGGNDRTFVGVLGDGTLSVLDGGTAIVDSTSLRLAWDVVSNGTVHVSGRGSTLASKGEIQVGVQGTASMTVEDGGLVVAPQVTVGAYRGGGIPLPNVLSLNGGSTPGSRGVLQVNSISLNGGRVAFDGGVLRAASDLASMITPSTISVGSRGAFVDSNGFDIGIDSRFTGAGGLTKTGDGTLTLMHSASTYLGATVVERGTLRVSTPFFTTVNMLPVTTELVVGNEADQGAAVLELNGIAQQVGALRSAGRTMSRIVTNGAATSAALTVDQAIDTTFAGQLTGNLALTKLGVGTLELAGINTYNGLTTVDQGTLAVNGSLAGDAVVGAGATLAGTGTISGTVTVNAGGVFAPGSSPGTLTVGGLRLSPASEVSFELGTSASDLVVVQHDLALHGALRFSALAGYTFRSGEVIPLFEVGGTPSGAFTTVVFPVSAGDVDWQLGFADGTLALTVMHAPAVPEPSTWALLAVGATVLAMRRRRVTG